jgi:hypothetical protein
MRCLLFLVVIGLTFFVVASANAQVTDPTVITQAPIPGVGHKYYS